MGSEFAMVTKRIQDIVIGERFRQDLGDVDSLARSIAEVGLLHPVVITQDNRLIAGRRRLLACDQLGWTEVPVHIVDLQDIARGELHENTVRKDFLPSEAVAIKKALEPVEHEAAKERQGTRTDIQETFLNVGRGQTRDKVAEYVGVSGRTLEKAEAVIDAAEQAPEQYGDLAQQMDTTGRVDGAYRQLKARQQAEVLKTHGQPLPESIYSTIVLDPPWDWGDEGDVDQFGRARPDYTTMPIEQVARLPVSALAADNAHIYLWITNRSLPKGFALLDRWGFRYITTLTWCKPSIGMGNYFRGSSEHVLFGVRGSLPLLRHDLGTWFTAPRGERFSEKPQAFYDLIESASPGPYLDMFARSQRQNWTSWGLERQ